MKKLIVIITTTMAFLVSGLLSANEPMRMGDDVSWKEVVKINFKIGKRGPALKIIEEHFRPASVKAKTPMPEMMLEMNTGDYDLLVVWHLKGGITDLTWTTSPDNIAWREALNELSGGEEAAQKIIDEYRSYIEKAENDLAIVKSQG